MRSVKAMAGSDVDVPRPAPLDGAGEEMADPPDARTPGPAEGAVPLDVVWDRLKAGLEDAADEVEEDDDVADRRAPEVIRGAGATAAGDGQNVWLESREPRPTRELRGMAGAVV